MALNCFVDRASLLTKDHMLTTGALPIRSKLNNTAGTNSKESMGYGATAPSAHRQPGNSNKRGASSKGKMSLREGDASSGQSGGYGGGDEGGDAKRAKLATNHKETGPWACPFRKRNRARFNIFEHESCAKPFKDLTKIKYVTRTSHDMT